MAEQWDPDRLHPEGAAGATEQMQRAMLGDQLYEEQRDTIRRSNEAAIRQASARAHTWQALGCLLWIVILAVSWAFAIAVVWTLVQLWQAVTG